MNKHRLIKWIVALIVATVILVVPATLVSYAASGHDITPFRLLRSFAMTTAWGGLIAAGLLRGKRWGWWIGRIYYGFIIFAGAIASLCILFVLAPPRLVPLLTMLVMAAPAIAIFMMLGHDSIRTHCGIKTKGSTTSASTATNEPAAGGSI